MTSRADQDSGRERLSRLTPALLGVLPLGWVLAAGGEAFGRFSVDLAGHLWTGWAVGQGGFFRSSLIGWPDSVDLLPVLGGWMDVLLVGAISQVLPLEVAYNLVIGLYLVVAGIGGWALARSLGCGRLGAAVAGLLLQLDGFVLQHLAGGRPEQVGLGFVALALALAIAVWRGRRKPYQAGLAGALLLLVSWELSLLLALTLALLSPFMGPAPAGAVRRWVRAAAVCLLVAGPWVGAFLWRTATVRSVDEGAFALELAHKASVGLLGWFAPGSARPSWAALACLLALPWTLPRPLRRLGLGLGCALLLVWLLASGPWPGLLQPGAPVDAPWGPFTWLRGLPLLGWFHWPDRLLALWSLVAVAAAGLALERLQRWRRLAAYIAATVVVVAAWAEGWHAQRLPRGGFRVPPHEQALALAQAPEEGAVLDLPMHPQPEHHLRYQLIQLRHQRPLLFNMVLSHLRPGAVRERVLQEPLLDWFLALMEGPPRAPRAFEAHELEGLRAAGFRYVVLHKAGWPQRRWRQGRQVLLTSLGEPWLQRGEDWICWRLEEKETRGKQ